MLAKIPSNSALHSPLLLNTLEQLSSAPGHALSPTSLTAPLEARRLQTSHPTSALHRAGTRTALGFGAGTISSVGLGLAGWAGALGTGPLSEFAGNMGGETAAALGLVGAMASARWAAGRWERAKKRWWEDWARIGQGLRRDLVQNVDTVMRVQVTAVPSRAAGEMEGIVRRWKREVDEAREGVIMLEDQVRAAEDSRLPRE
jgi:hypothetical protein